MGKRRQIRNKQRGGKKVLMKKKAVKIIKSLRKYAAKGLLNVVKTVKPKNQKGGSIGMGALIAMSMAPMLLKQLGL